MLFSSRFSPATKVLNALWFRYFLWDFFFSVPKAMEKNQQQDKRHEREEHPFDSFIKTGDYEISQWGL